MINDVPLEVGVDVDETAVIGSVPVLSRCAVIIETSPEAGEVVEVLVRVLPVLLVALDVVRDAVVTDTVGNEGLVAEYEAGSVLFVEV